MFHVKVPVKWIRGSDGIWMLCVWTKESGVKTVLATVHSYTRRSSPEYYAVKMWYVRDALSGRIAHSCLPDLKDAKSAALFYWGCAEADQRGQDEAWTAYSLQVQAIAAKLKLVKKPSMTEQYDKLGVVHAICSRRTQHIGSKWPTTYPYLPMADSQQAILRCARHAYDAGWRVVGDDLLCPNCGSLLRQTR